MFILFFAVTLRWMPVSGHVPFLKPLFEGEMPPFGLGQPARTPSAI